jgi:hypothetical protein
MLLLSGRRERHAGERALQHPSSGVCDELLIEIEKPPLFDERCGMSAGARRNDGGRQLWGESVAGGSKKVSPANARDHLTMVEAGVD